MSGVAALLYAVGVCLIDQSYASASNSSSRPPDNSTDRAAHTDLRTPTEPTWLRPLHSGHVTARVDAVQSTVSEIR